MRLRLIPRADRLLGRLPHFTIYSAAELLLLALVAVQAARLAWILVAPVGPVGDYKGAAALAMPGAGTALGDFDPFFRLSGGAATTVTSLDLKLYGVREDRATGRGSAIIALPDGTQGSFAVGEEIMPGVTLAEVAFDSVTISRGGTPEQIFLDQSEPVEPSARAEGDLSTPSAGTGIVAPPPAPAVPPAPVAAELPFRFQPRLNDGQVDGIVVGPGGDGGRAFRAAGFAPGDVVVSINGQRITSVEQAQALVRQSGGRATLLVDRGGRTLPIVIGTGR